MASAGSGPAPIAPPALRPGDTIALVSPSARLNAIFPLRVARATAFLERAGYTVLPIFTADLPATPFSTHVAARAAELHAAFANPAVRAIVCTIGGSTCNELLPALDPAVVRAHPKIFVGSSDITLLHHWLYAAAGLRSFYGPSAITSLGEWPAPLPFTWAHWQAILEEGTAGAVPRADAYTDAFDDWEDEATKLAAGTMAARELLPPRGWRWLKGGAAATGVLWGGCLPSVLQLLGTRWEVDYEGKILLIELPEGDAPGEGMPLERAAWHLMDLRMRGVLEKVAGVVVGRPYRYDGPMEEEWEATVLRAMEGFDVPVLAGVDVGHTDPMLTIPLGARVRLDSERDEWVILEPGVTARTD